MGCERNVADSTLIPQKRSRLSQARAAAMVRQREAWQERKSQPSQSCSNGKAKRDLSEREELAKPELQRW